MKPFAATVIALLTLAPTAGSAAPYRYLTAAELERKLTTKEAVVVLDIQVEAEYRRHHIRGARPTYAYPVKTPDEKARLDPAVKEITGSSAPVVIVCPRGAGGAERTVDYLLERKVPAERLFILEKGQAGWSSPELTEGR